MLFAKVTLDHCPAGDTLDANQLIAFVVEYIAKYPLTATNVLFPNAMARQLLSPVLTDTQFCPSSEYIIILL
jgi:hypothetical protein